MATNNKPPSDNPIVAVLNTVLGPLVEQTSKLPPVLAYGSAVVIAVLAITLLGIIIPNSVLWLVGVVVILCLAAFVFADLGKRRSRKMAHDISGLAWFHVVVHDAGDETKGIAGAEVRVELPEPKVQRTQDNGQASFNVPEAWLKRAYHINAEKEGYEKREPIQVKLAANGYYPVPLKRDEKIVLEKEEKTASSNAHTRLRLTQFKPARGEFVESISGRLAIGRDPTSNELVLPGDAKGVSWTHGIIELLDGCYVYRHLSSSQPTTIIHKDGSSILLVGGEEKKADLRMNDRLVIGNYEFMVTYDLVVSDVIYTPT